MQCGPVRYLVDAKSQVEKRAFSHYVIPRFTRARLPAAKKIQDIYTCIIGNESRTNQIISDAVKLIAEGRAPLLLTERKDHAVRLAEELRGKADHIFLLLESGNQKAKREKLATLRAVPASKSLVVVATGKYIGEGFDEPRLDTILLAVPVSWKGTLAQYAGRLHQNYEGKQEVRIYDYVDIHIPALERMYHKRLKGYPELGYAVKMSEQDVAASQIYDGQNYLVPFMSDLSDATKEILLVCPFLNKSRIKAILPTLEKKIAPGVSVTVCTRAPEIYRPEQRDAIGELIASLKESRIDVKIQKELLYRYAVIDQSIVWYGNIEYLSYSMKDANALRFESSDTAGELLDLRKKEDELKQLHLEMSV